MSNEKKPKKKSAAPPKEHKPSWQERQATVQDIKAFLDERVMLRHNVVTGQVECHQVERGLDIATDDSGQLRIVGSPSRSPSGAPVWSPLTDRVVNTLWAELAGTKTVRKQDIQNIIESDYVPEYNPFRFYLDRLPPWNEDKGDYIMELSLSVNVRGDSDEQILFYQYLKKWLMAMVAGWLDADVVNNVILVLIGEQGSYKTTWFSHLLPPELRQFFRIKTNASRMTKDDLLALTQYGLMCCEELDTMRPAELNELKSAVTMPSVDERRPYGRYHEHRAHLASFCGTGNNVQFLSDATGNRRWLPFEVESITSPREQPFCYEGIYGQAYRLYRDGFQYWFLQAEIQRLNRHNEQFEVPKKEQELVDAFFYPPEVPGQGKFMPVTMAMQLFRGYTSQPLDDAKVGLAFRKMGFQPKRTKFSRGYIVMQRTPAEIETRMKSLAQVTGDG